MQGSAHIYSLSHNLGECLLTCECVEWGEKSGYVWYEWLSSDHPIPMIPISVSESFPWLDLALSPISLSFLSHENTLITNSYHSRILRSLSTCFSLIVRWSEWMNVSHSSLFITVSHMKCPFSSIHTVLHPTKDIPLSLILTNHFLSLRWQALQREREWESLSLSSLSLLFPIS